MSKFKPGTVEKKQMGKNYSTVIGPPAGIELIRVCDSGAQL